MIFGSAIALELAEAFLPDRHARFVDALEKIVGGGAGVMLGVARRVGNLSSHGRMHVRSDDGGLPRPKAITSTNGQGGLGSKTPTSGGCPQVIGGSRFLVTRFPRFEFPPGFRDGREPQS